MQPIQYISSSASRYWATRNSSLTLSLVQEHIFSKNHKQFHIISWKLDKLHCQFPVLLPGSPHLPLPLTLHCNITESYPSPSPIRFVDSDDPNLTSVLECLEDTKNNKLTPRTWTLFGNRVFVELTSFHRC
ncbi:PREDICTED: ubiquitin-conjugating enzyme E2 Q2-like [Rhinopithecus bieti]|uniref:ubiquitin-conjugating enzyme E2 Q2-like n=1 Tax=Rhinopithecus bieti TaxID=61621 RepID=UPI00083C5883|nr:PREDICTED: ubiquitin-conjugating enzyme E2 Q2-like [Rhinopithecus bieti]XP_017747645.1 PREDICTED: ubiquitin-conjugating enzyme E2 Q2-like [Rhinopithecus bieti]XP_017747646.1 PREDICTED: ubiquitin-conjugating enzyme E2 Q2-like [Rhinopithecus bieti]